MLVNKDGDLELYAVHDTPVHPSWSTRGDLTLGIGCSYTIISGITDLTPAHEPWELLASRHSRPGSRAYSMERPDYTDDGSVASRGLRDSPMYETPPATFGRGDEDGFPALSPPATSRTERTTSPGRSRRPVKSGLPFEHTAMGKSRARREPRHEREGPGPSPSQPHAPHTTPRTITAPLDDDGHGGLQKKSPAVRALQHVLEVDISMLMRRRAMLAYGLLNVSCTLILFFFSPTS